MKRRIAAFRALPCIECIFIPLFLTMHMTRCPQGRNSTSAGLSLQSNVHIVTYDQLIHIILHCHPLPPSYRTSLLKMTSSGGVPWIFIDWKEGDALGRPTVWLCRHSNHEVWDQRLERSKIKMLIYLGLEYAPRARWTENTIATRSGMISRARNPDYPLIRFIDLWSIPSSLIILGSAPLEARMKRAANSQWGRTFVANSLIFWSRVV